MNKMTKVEKIKYALKRIKELETLIEYWEKCPEIKIIQNTTIPRINPIKIPVEQSIPDTQHVTKTLPPTLTMPCVNS